MLNQVTQQHYALLQNKFLVETMQQQQNQQSSSPNKINKQIIMEDDRASELASCRKARVSIRARSDFSLVYIFLSYNAFYKCFYSSASSRSTITLDLTQPSNSFFKFQMPISSNNYQPFPLSLHEGLCFSSNVSTTKPSDSKKKKNLSFIDVVCEAIIKAALDAALSSLT